jgi:hypothetical protein
MPGDARATGQGVDLVTEFHGSEQGRPTWSGLAFDQLMASIGLLMVRWSRLDHHLSEEIIRLRSIGGDLAPSRNRLRATTSERLAEWRALQSRRNRGQRDFHAAVEALADRIQSLARLRNLITQGFVGASGEDEVEPWIWCNSSLSSAGPPDARLERSDLDAAIAEMDQCERELTILGPD